MLQTALLRQSVLQSVVVFWSFHRAYQLRVRLDPSPRYIFLSYSKKRGLYQSASFCVTEKPCAAEVRSLTVRRLDAVFSLKALCVVLVYIPLSYREHRHSRGPYFHYINRKQSHLRRRSRPPRPAYLQPALPLSRCISVAGWNICFCCSKKLFVCLNNYAPMVLISFLKSLESHYPVSGPSRFRIFRNPTRSSVESRRIRRATVGSPLTFRRSRTGGSTRPICNLLE